MKIKIDVDTRTFIRFGLVVLGFVLSLLIIYKVQTALTTVGIAFFLALALNPPVSFLSKKLPGKSRVGATALAYVAVIGALAGLLFLVVPPVIEQSSKFAQTVPQLIDDVNGQRYVVDDFIDRYGLNDELNTAVENAKNQASSVAANIGNLLVVGASSVFNGVITLLIILVLTFLMLIEGPAWLARVWKLYKNPERLNDHKALVQRMYRVVTGYVNGQMLIAFIAALATAVVILILSALFPLPANLAVPLAAIIFVSGLIPMVGATIGAIVVGLILLLNSVAAAVVFTVYFIVYQQIENNFISPTVQSKAVELSALSVLITILIGVNLFGLIGGIISIPIAGCIRVLVIHYLANARKAREVHEKNPLAKLVEKAKA